MFMPTTTRPAAGGQALERPRYFPRQMITPDDLTQGLDYSRARMRRHNRAMHGWGVVYGAAVLPVFDADGAVRKVTIKPGFILTPQGDEVEVATDQVFDTTREATPGATSGADDPCYSDIFVDRRDAGVKYLAIRYDEVPSHPVRIGPSACDCGGTGSCEYSRLRDSYRIELLNDLPRSHVGGTSANDRVAKALTEMKAAADDAKKLAAVITNLFSAAMPLPPDPVSEPWVVLATLHFDSGVVTAVDPITTRRLVATTAPTWWRPIGPEMKIQAVKAESKVNATEPKLADLTITVTGTGLLSIGKDDVHFEKDSEKISKLVVEAGDRDDKLVINGQFTAGPTPPAPGKLQLTRSDGTWATSPEVIAIPAVPAPPVTP